MSGWKSTPGIGKALYPFAGKGSSQLSLNVGDVVVVTQEASGWYRGYLQAEPGPLKIFPAAYVQFTPTTTDDKKPVSETTETSATLSFEQIKAAARAANMDNNKTKETLAKSEPEPEPIEETKVQSPEPIVVEKPVSASAFLSSPVSSPVAASTSRAATANKSTKKNVCKVDNPDLWLPTIDVDTREASVLEGFFSIGAQTDDGVIPATIKTKNAVEIADGYRLIDPTTGANSSGLSQDSSFTRISKAQALVADDQESLGNIGVFTGANGIFLESDGLESLRKYHLFLDVKVCIFAVTEETELLFSLFSVKKNQYISEDFVINLPPPGHKDHTQILGKMKTIFRDLDPYDFQSEIHLICRIFRKGALLYDPKELGKPSKEQSGTESTRRCFGCAMTNITTANLTLPAMIGREYEPPPANFSIFTPIVETNFHRIHELMLNPALREKELEPAPRAKGIALGMTLFEGNLDNVRVIEKSRLNNVCETRKLSFPKVFNPIVPRNDLYITLLDGSFSQDKKTAARNVEVHVRVIRNDYLPIDQVIYRGSGEEPLSEYKSGVYYHSNTPVFNESIRVVLDPETLTNSHLYFEFWHVSTTAKKSAPFSCAFFPLTPSSSNNLFGATHSVTMYKPFSKGDQYLHDSSKASVANSRKETFRFILNLHSTSLTRNQIMTKISEWKTLDKPFLQSSLMSYLLKSSVSNTDEVARYIRVILDSLFGILSSNAHQDTHMYAFNAISHTIARLAPSYHRVILLYIKHCFNDANTYSRMIPFLSHALEQQTEILKSQLASFSVVSQIETIPPYDDMPAARGRVSIFANDTSSAFKKANNMIFSPSIADSTPSISSQNLRSHDNFSNTPTAASTPTFRPAQGIGKMPALEEVEEDVSVSDIPEVIRITRASIYLVSIAIKSYLESESVAKPVVSATATPAGFRAPPPIATTSAVPAAVTASSRDDFKQLISNLFNAVSEFMKLAIPDAKSLRTYSQGQVSILQNFSQCLPWLYQLYDPSEVTSILKKFIESIPTTAILSPYKLGLLRAILVGSDSVPAVSLPNKSLIESEITARSVNTIVSLPRILQASLTASQQAVNNEIFDLIVPTIISATSDSLNLGLRSRAISEGYSAIALLQLLYIRIANSSIYQSVKNEPYLITKLSMKALLPILPSLISTVHTFQVYSPDSNLTYVQQDQQSVYDELKGHSPHGLQVPSAFELRSAFVDPIVDSTLLLTAIIHGISDDDIQHFIYTLNKEDRDKTVARLLFICSNIIEKLIFPSRWIYISVFPLTVVVRILCFLRPVLRTHFVNENYSSIVWVSWLQLALSIRQTEHLDIDNMHSSRASFVTEHFGDVRSDVFSMFEEMWSILSDEQRVSTASLLVEKLFLLMSYSSSTFVSFAMNVYYDLLCAQFRVANDFSEVERYSIDALYEIANTSTTAGNKCMTTLQSNLKDRFASESNNAMANAGHAFLDHVSAMFSLMASLLRFPNAPEYEDDRTSVALQLINYIERTGHSANTRKAMYTRYVQYLVNLHADAGNHVECAITRLQQAKVLDWATTNLEAFDRFPAGPEHIRKEQLIKLAIESFIKGEDWERAIDRLDYLRHYYQHMIYDFRALTNTLAQLAEYFSKSQSSSRFYYKYFRVCFYGKFEDPTLAKDCEFVYKGVKLENIMEFTTRIKKRYPNANFVMSSDKPTDDVLAKAEQTICIAVLNIPEAQIRTQIVSKCAPGGSKNEFFEQFAGAVTSLVSAANTTPLVPVPTHIARHRDNDSIRVFEYSKPWRRSQEKNPANEFKDLWLIRTYIVVAEAFPSNRRRIPVVAHNEVILAPIMHAIESIKKKTSDLTQIAQNIASVPFGSPADCGPLSMTLQGIVDAAVNGGTNKYIEAFLNSEFLDPSNVILDDEREDISKTIAQRRQHQEEMKQALRDQISVVREALTIFSQKREQSLKGLEDHITTSLMVMIQQNGPLIDLN